MIIDLVKKTMIKRIKDLNLEGIIISDGLLEKKNKTEQLKMLVVSHNNNQIKVIDFDKYDMYEEEEAPIIVGDVSGSELKLDNISVGIVSSYDPINGLFTLNSDNNVQTFDYNTIATIGDVDIEDENRLEITTVSTINVVHNNNITSKLRRYDLLLFTFDDENGDITSYYVDKIQECLRRAFPLQDENGQNTRATVYIQDNCRFDVFRFNKSNKVMRGTILLKTIV